MDRFKFRAWDKERKVMVYLDLGNTNPAVSRFHVALLSDYLREAYGVVMQSTGLHDKAGVLIYEGDVVEGIEVAGDEYEIGTIIFDFASFCIDIKNERYSPCLYESNLGQIRVIGNIYENPELVGGE